MKWKVYEWWFVPAENHQHSNVDWEPPAGTINKLRGILRLPQVHKGSLLGTWKRFQPPR